MACSGGIFATLLTLAFSASSLSVEGQAAPVRQEEKMADSTLAAGRVFVDKNGNGLRDRGEKNLRGVIVSDGEKVAVSGADGSYSFVTANPARVFAVAPEGYLIRSRGLQNRLVNGGTGRDIPLYRTSRRRSCRFAAVGDIQADSLGQLKWAEKSVIAELKARHDLDFFIHGGDLVNDKMNLLPAALSLLDSVGIPCWNVIGNHDLDPVRKGKYRSRTPTSWLSEAGSDLGGFIRAGHCFLLLDDVMMGDGDSLDSGQIAMVRKIEGMLPRKFSLVICLHEPLSLVSNRYELLKAFGGRRTLVISAHMHYAYRKEWAPEIHEVCIGASCGQWWTGQRGADSVPLAIMNCGTPRGYYVFDMDRKGEAYFYKPVGRDEALSVWVKTADVEAPELKGLPDGTLAVNVYGGGEATKVEASLDGRTWIPLSKTSMMDPTVSKIRLLQSRGGYPEPPARRQPLLRANSPHIWSAFIPELTGADNKSHPEMIYIRVRDPYGLSSFVYKGNISTFETLRVE